MSWTTIRVPASSANLGPGFDALGLALGLVASLTLAPILLHWLRGAVFFPFKPPHHVQGADVEEEPGFGGAANVQDAGFIGDGELAEEAGHAAAAEARGQGQRR